MYQEENNCWEDFHSLADLSQASTGLPCKLWNSTPGIRHSQFAYTIGGSIRRSAGVSRGGAERLFFSPLCGRPSGDGEQASASHFASLFLCRLEAAGVTRESVSFQKAAPKER